MDNGKFFTSLATDQLEATLDRNEKYIDRSGTFVAKAKAVLQVIGLLLFFGSAISIIQDGIGIPNGVELLLTGLLAYWFHRDNVRWHEVQKENPLIRAVLFHRRHNPSP